MGSLTGKTVLVTGAARRLGRAIAAAVVEAGAGVVVHHRHSAREAEQFEREVQAHDGECWLIRADLENGPEVETLVERASVAAGRSIDVLVNNASVFPADSLASFSRESMERTLAINAWAPLVLCQSLAKHTRRGHIVNLLDAKLDGYRLGNVSYQTSKHVLALLTRMFALELAPGIAVNAVAPGLILPPPGKDGNWLQRQARTSVPFARPGTPADVALAVVFLLSSSYLTGQILYVDGGRHLLEPNDGPHPH